MTELQLKNIMLNPFKSKSLSYLDSLNNDYLVYSDKLDIISFSNDNAVAQENADIVFLLTKNGKVYSKEFVYITEDQVSEFEKLLFDDEKS